VSKMTNKEISIFSNSSHFERRAELSDTLLKGDHPRTIPVKFPLIWFSGFRGEDLNVIVYQFELKWSLSGPLSKLCVTPPFSISTLDVKLKSRWAITGSWEPLILWSHMFQLGLKYWTPCLRKDQINTEKYTFFAHESLLKAQQCLSHHFASMGVTHNFESGPLKDHFNSNFWVKDFDVNFIS
jgi:hypothetical protein